MRILICQYEQSSDALLGPNNKNTFELGKIFDLSNFDNKYYNRTCGDVLVSNSDSGVEIIPSAWASVNNQHICLTKNGRMDYDCSCRRKNNCIKFDKKVYEKVT